ncbi:MAG: tetratricopeptide repeat protein [Tepidisphaeraceae bacterium]
MNTFLAALISIGLVGFVSTEPPSTNPANSARAGEFVQDGWKLWQKQQYTEAREMFTQATQLDPNNAEAWNGLGWSQFNGGDVDKSEDAFTKCVAIAPNHPAGLNGLGQIYLSRADYAQAEKVFLQAGPAAPAAWWGLTRIYLLQGKFEEAEKWAQKLVDSKQSGDDLTARRMLDSAKAKKIDDNLRGQLEPQIASEGAKEIQKGFALWQQGRMEEAKKLIEHAYEIAPEDPTVLNGVGWYRMNTGDSGAAQLLFERAIELQPGSVGALNGLATCLKHQGRTDEAIVLWTKMLDANPNAVGGAWGLAETYMERNQPDKALDLYEKMAKLMPENENIQEALARAKEAAGK